MEGRRRPRRNYDNYRQNRIVTRTRNLDNFYASNFGIYPRRQQPVRSNRGQQQQLAPLRNPRRGRPPTRNVRLDQPLTQRNPRRRIQRRVVNRNGNVNNPVPRNNQRNRRNTPNNGNQQRRRRNQNAELQKPTIRKVVDRRVSRRRLGPVGKLEISNLGPDVVNTDLLQIFSVYGRLKRCAVLFSEGASTGKGVVQYFSRVCAQRAQNDLNNTFLKSTNIAVNLVQKANKKANLKDNSAQDTNMK